MKEKLKKEIETVLVDFGVENPQVNFDYPRMDFGDLSTNVAMAYAKELGKKPLDLAEEIKSHLATRSPSEISRIEVVAPGFINFFFEAEYFTDNVKKVLSDKDFGKNKSLDGQKIIIEYTDPNPFKEFHIGHLMSNTIGEAISRVVEASGAEVKRVNYQGDIGLHVAKAVWAIRKGVASNEAYAYGHKAYEENEVSKAEIIEVNKKIYDKSDPEINKIYEEGRKESLAYFEEMYHKLGTKFDMYFFESETATFGKGVVEKNVPEVFEQSEGAVVFRGEKYDSKLHTRVFITKEGLPTYETKELGLAKIKYDKYPYDKSIVVTGSEINEYFKVLLSAMAVVFPDLAQKTKHISHGMLRLPEGKMSSRTGNVITAESLIEKIKEKVLKKINDREDMSRTRLDTDGIAEIVAIGAIKYSILRQAIGGDIIFDFDKSISFEGDSGPYLQYSAVRAHSVLKRAQFSIFNFQFSIPGGWQTTNLERYLERFPDVVVKAGSEYAPHYVVTYLIELAGEFNSFYASHKIIGEKDPTSPYRLALTEAFVQVLTSGLDLLGIKVPEKM